MNLKFSKIDRYSSYGLACLIVAEIACVAAFRLVGWEVCIATGCIFAVMMVVLGIKASKVSTNFYLSPFIITKLLSNTLAPSKLSVLYLLAFVVHISWLSDSLIGFTKEGEDAVNLFTALTSIVGLGCLAYFSPSGKKEKEGEPHLVFVSGISEIKHPHTKKIEDSNLFPLVEVLVELQKGVKTNTLLVLATDAHTADKMNVYFSDDATIDALTGNDDQKAEQLKKELHKAGESYRYNKDLEDAQRALIKAFAKYHLGESFHKQIEQLEIRFTPPCNYNDYAMCLDALRNKLNEYEESKENVHFLFNLTPGNVVVSSVITLLSIDSNRDLFYYSQDENEENRLKEVNKKQIPMSNLLSQALENIRN